MASTTAPAQAGTTTPPQYPPLAESTSQADVQEPSTAPSFSPPAPTFTTNIRPYSASGAGVSPATSSRMQALRGPGPSISTRTSFTRVGGEDEEDDPPFPARPATAAASTSAGPFPAGFGGLGFGWGAAAGGRLNQRWVELPPPPSKSGNSSGSAVDDVDGEVRDGDGEAPPPRVVEVADEGHDARDQHEENRRPRSASHVSHSPPQGSMPPSPARQPTELPPPVQGSSMNTPPQAMITFLFITGRRRTMSFDPETTVGRVKELVWNTWPSEDEEWQNDRPPAPSYLRLLYLGRLLQDDDTLTKLKILITNPSSPQPTIMHLSIRPHVPPVENNENLNKKRSLRVRRDDNDPSSGCCGCIIC